MKAQKIRRREKSYRIAVLQSEPASSRNSNPYFEMLFDAIAETDDPQWFTWRRALFGRFDLFHLHLPEAFVASPSRLKVLAKRVLLEALIFRLRVSRIPVVWTVHHLEPYEKNSRGAERARLRLESLAGQKIYLHAGIGHESATSTTIMIGEYRNWFADFVGDIPKADNMFLCFGLMRPYKNVEALIDAFKNGSSSWELVLAGRASPASYAEQLTAQIANHPGVDARFTYLPDETLVRLIQQASAVVLPYREMYNSSAALTSLSLETPVLVPLSEANQRLQDEFGPEWVITYPSELSVADLERALSTAAALQEDASPDLSNRSWAEIGKKHHGVYRRTLSTEDVTD